MRKTKKSDRFFKDFAGEFVMVVTNVVASKPTMEDEMPQTVPIMLEGYLIDQDEEYYFIGATPDKANQVVKKNSVVIMQCIDSGEDMDVLTHVLDQSNGGEDGTFH